MPQPNLPAPLAPRPDPGAQLLEAVRERHAQRSLKLAQQWVHRRGVLDLQRFCSTRLAGAQGPQAVAWLQDLLALETPTLPSDGIPAPSAQAAATGIPFQPEAAGTATASLSETSPVAWAEPAGPADPTEQDLQARAVAAVDEAFAALAQSFQEEDQALTAAPPSPLATGPLAAPLAASMNVPQPLPVRRGLWPSLRASAASFSSALRPPRHGSPNPLVPTPQDRARPLSEATASGPDERGLDDNAQRDAIPLGAPPSSSAGDPQPQDSPTLAEPPALLAASGDPAPEEPDQPQDAAQSSADPASSVAAHPTDATNTAHDGLLGRLRGRIQQRRLPRLSRLRAVMQDCVEETVALLRTPQPEPQEEDGGFEVSQPPEPAWPARDQSGISWTLDPFLPPPPLPVASSEPQAEATATEPPAPPASRRRFSLPVTKPAAGGDRPAPAPDALSDLRAWLPDRGDLPRAS